jgi:hypothetical protein
MLKGLEDEVVCAIKNKLAANWPTLIN